jgi:hypothetical protein
MKSPPFEQDPDPQAYERLIDRLLDSPHYGERWARHWMDIARFAESHGYEQDYDRPHAYPYRDFLIQALNNDLPYDQFVQWQIAGDELTQDDPLGLAATGFLGAGAFPTQLTEAEFESARYDELDDMIATLGTAVLGVSIGCARCHDHKFDPISAEEYYRLASVSRRPFVAKSRWTGIPRNLECWRTDKWVERVRQGRACLRGGRRHRGNGRRGNAEGNAGGETQIRRGSENRSKCK